MVLGHPICLYSIQKIDNVQTFDQSSNVIFNRNVRQQPTGTLKKKECSGCASFTMPNLVRTKLAGVSRIGLFFFILLNNPVEKRTKATIGWNIQDCPLAFYFILMSRWILRSLKIMNWLAHRLKASDSPQNRNSKSQGNVSSFLQVPSSLRN